MTCGPLSHPGQYYKRLATQIAAGSASGLQALVFSAWARLLRSNEEMRAHLLSEHRGLVRRRWLHKLHKACARMRTQLAALRSLIGSTARRILETHCVAWRQYVVSQHNMRTISRLHLGRVRSAHHLVRSPAS